MANATENDAGLDDAHAVRMVRIKAWGVPDNAIHIFDAAALNALDMMMIVVDACLVTGAVGIGRADAADDAVIDKVMDDQVNRLKRKRRQGQARRAKNRIRVRVRVMMQEIQNRDALRGGAQPLGPHNLRPVVMAMRFVDIVHERKTNKFTLADQYIE